MVEPNNIQLGVVHETSSLRDATEKHGPCCKFGIIEICSLHCINFTNFYYVTVFLARSAKVAERAICFTVRNFFLFFLFLYSSFLMISRRQIISRSAGPIFAVFTSNESFLAVDDRSGPLFSISEGTLPWQPILCKKWKTPHFRRSGIHKRYEVTPCMGRIK